MISEPDDQSPPQAHWRFRGRQVTYNRTACGLAFAAVLLWLHDLGDPS